MLLDSPSEEGFDRITRLAARALRLPFAVVALVDAERQFFKSTVGFPQHLIEARQSPLFAGSLCCEIIETGAPLAISQLPDEGNPVLRALGGRAFAGVPLRTEDGWVLGALCVVDAEPRSWSPEELDLLEDLAATVMTEVELRRKAQEARAQSCRAEAAQRAASAEREEYLQLVNDLDGIVWEADAITWQITFVSRQTEAILGYPVEQWMAREDFWQSILHPEDRERIISSSLEVIGAGQDHHAEYRVMAADGRVVWFRDLVRVIRDDRGQPRRIRGFMLDITAEKESQAALAASEERFRALIDNATDIITILDADGTIRYESPSIERSLGYRPEELVGRTVIDFVHPEDLPAVRELFGRLRDGESTLPAVMPPFRFRASDGSWRYIECTASNLLDDPAVRGIVVNSRDQTERVLADRARQRAEARYRQIVETAHEGIALVDPDGVITFMNQRLADLAGYTIEEAVGQPAARFFTPDDTDLAAHFERRRRGLSEQYTGTLLRRDGGQVRTLVAASPHVDAESGYTGSLVMITDLTALTHATEALRSIAAKVRCILWQADVTLEGDRLNWKVRLSDEEAAQRFLPLEVRPGESYGAAWHRNRLDGDRERADDYARQEVLAGRRYSQEFRCWDRNGNLRWLQEDVEVEGAGPGRWKAVGVCSDVTQRKFTEEALRASEARFRAIFDGSAIGIAVVDLDGKPVHVNEALQRMLGYSAEELSHMSFTEFTHPDDLEADWVLYQELMSGRRSAYQVEKRYVRKDGKVVWGRLTASVALGEQHGIRFALSMVEDVTERKRAEVRDAAFRSMGQRLNVATTPEDAARVVLEVAEQLSGWDCCWLELVDRERDHAVVVLSMDLIDGVRTDVTPADRVVEIRSYTLRVMHEGPLLLLRDPDTLPKPGTTGHHFFGDKNRPSASLLCVPIRSGTQVVGALSIQSYSFNAYGSEDLSTLQALADYCAGALERTQAEAAQRHLQEQLVQAQRMEAVGRLAGGIAHDFNNMLAVINGYSELMLMGPDTPRSLLGPAEEIRKAGERAASLTRQLLAFSRKQIIQPQVLDLSEIVSNIQRMLRRLIGEDIELVTASQYSRTGIGRVKADPGQIEQVLMNLVVNARDAMPRGGRLTLGLRNVHREATRTKDGDEAAAGLYVELSVTDTGCGMDAETMSQIFEPFFTTKEVGEGTGLGLATVYGIIKQNQGYITVESTPAEGSTFRVYLPCLEQPQAELPAEALPLELPTGTETVLVVEDEAMLRTLIADILRPHGYHVLVAGDVAEALQCCREPDRPIHLLLTDVIMPGQSGQSLAEEAVRLHPGLKVIFMSGHTDDAVIRHGVSRAETHFVQKPFVPTVLLQKVRDVLDS
jgi:PAS domain S-box-containing protein